MIPILHALFNHMAWADAAVLSDVRAHAGAGEDEQIRGLLHHIVSVERFFLALLRGREPDAGGERQQPATLDEMDRLFRETHREALEYVNTLEEPELRREIAMPRMPEVRLSARDLMLQIVMHSEHHRAQCAMRLRALGGKPSITDYIMWARQQKPA